MFNTDFFRYFFQIKWLKEKTKIIISLKIKLRLGNVVFVQKVVWLKITKLILKTDIRRKTH